MGCAEKPATPVGSRAGKQERERPTLVQEERQRERVTQGGHKPTLRLCYIFFFPFLCYPFFFF